MGQRPRNQLQSDGSPSLHLLTPPHSVSSAEKRRSLLRKTLSGVFATLICLLGDISYSQQRCTESNASEPNTMNVVRWTSSLPALAGRKIEVRLALYENPTGGLPLWSEVQSLSIGSDGCFSALLGMSSPDGLPEFLFSTQQARWVEAQPLSNPGEQATPSEVSEDKANRLPRALLAPTAYALKASDTDRLGGRASGDYVTTEELKAAVRDEIAKGVPPIGSIPITLPTAQGNPGSIPVWTSPAIQGNSLIYQSGQNVGIGTIAPSSALDVAGVITGRTAIDLASVEGDTGADGRSAPLRLTANIHSNSGGASVPQNFLLQAEPRGNHSGSPSAQLSLLFGSGSNSPIDTGLSILPNGVINFVPEQTFPGVYGAQGPQGPPGNATISSGDAGQFAQLVSRTTIQGISPAQALDALIPGATISGSGSSEVINLPGKINAGSVNASSNSALLITALPYNAKCDGKTIDTSAIQAAFDDAAVRGLSVEFPSGICLTGTIHWSGQSFFGHGMTVTKIVGLPGQDVFATPDGKWFANQNVQVHDLTVNVDNTVDASASVAGGNNTFPNRVFGTAGDMRPISPPISPGPVEFGSAFGLGGCSGSISQGSTLFTLPCGHFSTIQPVVLIGSPLTVKGAGPSGSDLETKIAAYVSDTQVNLAAPASTSVTKASGSYLKPLTPPWYCGNAAFAIPDSDGKTAMHAPNGWSFDNIYIEAKGGYFGWNHACGMFLQAPIYGINLGVVTIRGFFGGYIEALPVMNVDYVTWTPDQSNYENYTSSFNLLPWVSYNGSHRVIRDMNIYGGSGGAIPTFGPFFLTASTGSAVGLQAYDGSSSISHIYDECYSYMSGEQQRYMGYFDIGGGSMAQCNPPSYVQWLASNSYVGAAIGINLKIAGSHNQFPNYIQLPSTITDSGLENKVITNSYGGDPYTKRSYFSDPIPLQDPVGRVDGSFLLGGNGGTPFLNGSDLLTTCVDYRMANAPETGASCIADSNGTELTKRYLSLTGNREWNTGVAVYTDSFKFGRRLPQSKMNVITQGECVGSSACTLVIQFGDSAGPANAHGSCTLSYGENWTMNGMLGSPTTCIADFSSAVSGNNLQMTIKPGSGSPSEVRIAFIAFQPQVIATQINGAQIPNNAALIGTNSAGQLVDVTAASLNINIAGSAANLSGTPALPNGTVAATQAAGDDSEKLATDRFVGSALSSLSKSLPAMIYKSGDLMASASISAASSWTAIAAGTYRITLMASVAIAANDGTLQANLACNSGESWTGGSVQSLNQAFQTSSTSVLCGLLPGEPFRYSVALTSTSGFPQVRYRLYVESLP